MARRKTTHGDRGARREEAEEEARQEEGPAPAGRVEGGPEARREAAGAREGEQGEGRQVERLTPLAEAADLLRRARRECDTVVVGLSGGKDSLATLDLCVREFGASGVRPFHMYVVRGLRCVEDTLRWCERRYGVEVEFVPHWRLGLAYKYATYMPHRRRADGWRDTRQKDIEQAVRSKVDGSPWIAYGHRQNDSIERVGMLKRCGGFDRAGRRVYPLRSWNEASVLAYLRARRIPPPPRLTILGRSMTGVNFQEDTLLAIRERYPDDFALIVEKFPYLPAKLARYELKKGTWKQDTYVDTWRTPIKDR